jgi:hypothetical protein
MANERQIIETMKISKKSAKRRNINAHGMAKSGRSVSMAKMM